MTDIGHRVTVFGHPVIMPLTCKDKPRVTEGDRYPLHSTYIKTRARAGGLIPKFGHLGHPGTR